MNSRAVLHRAVEALDVADLEYNVLLDREVQELLRLVNARRHGLLDEHVYAVLHRELRHFVMSDRRHDDADNTRSSVL